MGRKAIKIESTDQINELIKAELSRRSQISRQYYKRLKVIELALSGFKNKDISFSLNYTKRSVNRWRARWHSHQDELFALEQKYAGKRGLKQQLSRKIQSILSDAPRSGSPGHLTDPQCIRIQALACESPKDHGLPFTNWTHQRLSDALKAMGIEVSRSQVGAILKKTHYYPINHNTGCFQRLKMNTNL